MPTPARPSVPYVDELARLSPSRRRADIDRLIHSDDAGGAERFDLVVIGAGVTGSGVALDAATRGLSVLLVDAHDLAFGTSRWSSKLAHGGLRYLATGNVGIATRSARERGTLMESTAPHLTRALPQVVPVQDRYPLLTRILPRLGFIAGDALRIAAGTKSSTLPRSRTVSAGTVKELCPTVETSDLRFGYVNYDGQLVDDARLVTCLARTAAGFGASVLGHMRAVSASGDRVVLRDELSEASEPIEVSAKAVVNATGVWAGDLHPDVHVSPSRGTHLVIDSARVGNPAGSLTVPVPGATNRFCFVLPQLSGHCYIGLTDEAQSGEIPDVPTAPESDIQWILDVVNQALSVKLTEEDVIHAYAGLRPLITLGDADESNTADLSRDHVILTAESGLVTVTGGKLTEYRRMAEEVVDTVVDQRGFTAGPCITSSTPLVGAPRSAACRAVAPSDLAGLPGSLVARFGYLAPQVVAASKLDRPTEPVAPGVDTVRAEFSYHVGHEGATTISDILDRRSRIGLVPEQRAASVPAAREALAAFGITDDSE